LTFGQTYHDPTWIYLEDTTDSKAVFSGELFPVAGSSVASSTGVYFDTLILPDPFVKISPLLKRMSPKEKCYDVVRLALQVLEYKDLALAEVQKPIVAVLPDRHNFEENYQKFVYSCAEDDTTKHAEELFGREFEGTDELRDYLNAFNTAEEVVRNLVVPEKLLFATEWGGNLVSNIGKYIEEHTKSLGIKKPSDAVFMAIFSRFSQANDTFQRSKALSGTPIIQAPTSWTWYSWMLGLNSSEYVDEKLVDLHISRAFETTVKNEMTWLGNIPNDSLIEIRKSRAIDEIRNVIGRGISEFVHANPQSFYRTGDKVFDNLQNAFDEHEKKLKELSAKKWTFAGKDIGSFLVVGGIELTAALTGLPLYGGISVLSGMSGVIPSAKELKEKYAEIKKEERSLNRSGVGMLFMHEA
jgi:hypothetical protein